MKRPEAIFRRTTLFLAGATALLSGCAAAPSRDDPFEPWNRGMYEVHQVVDGTFIKPVAEAYVKYTPELIRTGKASVYPIDF